jgi:hypothetical protein
MTPTGAPAQPPNGFKGQLHACWTHNLSRADAAAIVQGKHAAYPRLAVVALSRDYGCCLVSLLALGMCHHARH